MNREKIFLAGLLCVLLLVLTHSCSHHQQNHASSSSNLEQEGPLPELAQNQVPENPNIQPTSPNSIESSTYHKDPNDKFEDVKESESIARTPHGKLQM